MTTTEGIGPAGSGGWFDLVPVGKAPLVGDVVEFDDALGMGVVEYGPGRRLDFHCTAITDGSRSIAVGSVVAFVITPGHLGRLEAQSVRPLPGVLPPGATLEVTAVIGERLVGDDGYDESGGTSSGFGRGGLG